VIERFAIAPSALPPSPRVTDAEIDRRIEPCVQRTSRDKCRDGSGREIDEGEPDRLLQVRERRRDEEVQVRWVTCPGVGRTPAAARLTSSS
jgi:hypothetical protein